MTAKLNAHQLQSGGGVGMGFARDLLPETHKCYCVTD